MNGEGFVLFGQLAADFSSFNSIFANEDSCNAVNNFPGQVLEQFNNLTSTQAAACRNDATAAAAALGFTRTTCVDGTLRSRMTYRRIEMWS